LRSPGPAIRTSTARRRISLRGWALLTVAIVAVVGSVYGASIGARRSIHATVAAPVAAAQRAHARRLAAPLLPVTAAVAAILGPGAHASFVSSRH
jgi:hypothetical protein